MMTAPTNSDVLGPANALIARLTERMVNPEPIAAGNLYAGVDLGTAYVVLAVVDQHRNPIDCAYTFAQVVRDGLVVDYVGAIRIVRQLKAQLEERIGQELVYGAAAYPPGTGGRDIDTHRHVAESAGFEVIGMVDEVSAANRVLHITDGAVVDVGGGTTGVAVLRDGQIVHLADEPTGGTHFSLVIAGAYGISFEEAEERKKNPAWQPEILRLVTPVIAKVSSIVRDHIAPYGVDRVYVVGGASKLPGFDDVMAKQLGVPVIKPSEPLLVTPLGIALAAAEAGEGE